MDIFFRKFNKRAIAFAVAFCMVILTSVINVKAFTTIPSTTTSLKSTELSATSSMWWDASISGTTIYVVYHDDVQIYGNSIMIVMNGDLAEQGLLNDNNEISAYLDTSDLSDGEYMIVFYEGKGYETHLSTLRFSFKKTGGKVELYYAGGKSERDFLNRINAEISPNDCNGYPTWYYKMLYSDETTINEIVNTAKNVTKNCSSDEEKVKAIHDWIATNIAYDYENYLNGTIENPADPIWAYNNKRAVCSGYTRLARVMFASVGIPCLDINGFASGASVGGGNLSPNTDYTNENHAWNAVYVNGSWKILDITWDSQNKYYGANSDKNVLNQSPKYRYYGIPAELISENHCSFDVIYTDLDDKHYEQNDNSYSNQNNGTYMTMYRLYNPNSGEHFYTANTSERDNLVNAGWKFEGAAWNAPVTSDTPVYRLYNPNAGDHHYTTSAVERDNLEGLGWKYEGIGWYSTGESGQALYRLYNPNAKAAGSHHYTTSAVEKDNLVSLGWRYEGIAWYGEK
ncbi:MAG: transglutaminase domain-containing protein [Lachnospiraceae bacterium]|nr:transglutaminase domain-containing protein [Lachnospiraceae bacterium]